MNASSVGINPLCARLRKHERPSLGDNGLWREGPDVRLIWPAIRTGYDFGENHDSIRYA